jgi:AdoMet-dependent heme synthase
LRLVAWEMTRACNLACVHCRASACSEPDPEELTTSQARELMDQIRTVGTPILIMTGGEPLMRSDFFELAQYAAGIGLRAVLATNGVMITRETARRIADVGLPRVSISLDGSTADDHDSFRGVPGAFAASLRGIANLKDTGVPVQINTTLTSRNRRRLSEIMRLAEDIGAAAYHVFLLVPTGRARDMSGEEMNPEEYEESLLEFYRLSRKSKMETKATCAPQYYRILRQQAKEEGIEVSERTFGLNARTRGCLAGLSFVFVSHKGDLQPCGYFDEQAGNVRDAPFPELWRNAPLFNRLRDFALLEGKCGKCEYVRFCGGCRARALEHTGRFTAEEPYCAYIPKHSTAKTL